MRTDSERDLDLNDLSDADVLAVAHELVEDFLEFLRRERPGSDILDVSSLPTSKRSLENAFRLVIVTEPRGAIRRRLVAAGCALAQFQVQIGDRLAISPAPAAEASKGGGDQTDMSGNIDRILADVAADNKRLRHLLGLASETAKRRHQDMAPSPPFRDDGTYTWHGHGRRMN